MDVAPRIPAKKRGEKQFRTGGVGKEKRFLARRQLILLLRKEQEKTRDSGSCTRRREAAPDSRARCRRWNLEERRIVLSKCRKFSLWPPRRPGKTGNPHNSRRHEQARQDLIQAGRGSPKVAGGMPTRAGSHLSRPRILQGDRQHFPQGRIL